MRIGEEAQRHREKTEWWKVEGKKANRLIGEEDCLLSF
jgi:hypothetical protein